MKKRTPRSQSTNLSKPGKVHHAKSSAPPQYPFSAIVGQEEMKLALMLNTVDPSIGGVLIMGHRGTGKSTAVRGLAELLPEIKVVAGCAYRCDPASGSNLCAECQKKLERGEPLEREVALVAVVDLPLGATEDRVCGTIDIERALRDGAKTFEPGLLARANRGLLYIDEVNLLEDHLVDLLLDVAVTGVNKVEREGISIEHPARFVLIGSGNPEEGELRPQLLDRFGLHVEVTTDHDLDRRVDIVERRQAFDHDPEKFCATQARDQQQLRNNITRAQRNSGSVKVDRPLLRQIAQLCTELKIDGHRGELTITRAARALAAFEGRKKITEDDVRQVAAMALRHRLRRDPLEETASTERIQQALEKVFSEQQNRREKRSSNDGEGEGASGRGNHSEVQPRDRGTANDSRTRRQSADQKGGRGADSPAEFPVPSAAGVALRMFGFGDRSRAERGQSKSAHLQHRRDNGTKRVSYNYERGRYARAVNFRKHCGRVAVDATLRASAAAGYGASSVGCRVSGAGKRKNLAPGTRHLTPNVLFKQLSRKKGRLFIFAIDASGSMAANRIRQAKGAALSLLKQSYIQRDRVAIVSFRGTSGAVLLQPSRSMLRARRVLDSLGVGGGTPLCAGLLCSLEVARQSRGSEGETILLLFTDGHANVSARANGNVTRAERQDLIEGELSGLGSKLRKAGVRMVVVDSDNEFGSSGHARALAEKLGGTYATVKPVI
jgi:magnesium chelatase ATPase subunit I